MSRHTSLTALVLALLLGLSGCASLQDGTFADILNTGNLPLDEEHDPPGARRCEGPVEEGRGDLVRDVADEQKWPTLRERRPLHCEGVPLDDRRGRKPAAKRRNQIWVPFDGDHVSAPFDENGREGPPPRADFQHHVIGSGLERVDDAAEDARIGKKVLAESALGSRHDGGSGSWVALRS